MDIELTNKTTENNRNDSKMPLEDRMTEFKCDSEKMMEINLFVDDVLTNAKNEVGKKLDARKVRKKCSFKGFDYIEKRLRF